MIYAVRKQNGNYTGVTYKELTQEIKEHHEFQNDELVPVSGLIDVNAHLGNEEEFVEPDWQPVALSTEDEKEYLKQARKSKVDEETNISGNPLIVSDTNLLNLAVKILADTWPVDWYLDNGNKKIVLANKTAATNFLKNLNNHRDDCYTYEP